MKLIDKYLLSEFIVPLLYCLCGFCMLYIIGGLFDKASDFMEAGIAPGDIAWFYGHFLLAYSDSSNVSFFVTILPVSLLAGALYSLCRLTRQNELMAMCASGVSIYRLIAPYLGVAFACSLLSVAVQEHFAPRSTRKVDEFKASLRKAGPRSSVLTNCRFYDSATRRRWLIARFDLKNPTLLEGVEVKQEHPDTSYDVKINAEKAEWRDGAWWFYGKVEQKYLPGNEPNGLPVGPEEEPVEMTGFTEHPDDIVYAVDIARVQKYSTSFAVLERLAKRGDSRTREMVMQTVDAHSRIAMPWVCVIATLLAIPAGVRGGRQGIIAGVMLAVALFIGYYVTKETAEFLGKKQLILPWLSAWLANIVFFVTGMAMILRIKS